MCGIVGAVSTRNIVPILIEGLKRLEYRGYDSCGVAVHQDGELKRARSTSRVAELEAQRGTRARRRRHRHRPHPLGHARRAGRAQRAPALLQPDRIALVHNGIIENHDELRAELQAKGYDFESQTDTEVIAHLVDHLYDGDLFDAVQRAALRLKGAYRDRGVLPRRAAPRGRRARRLAADRGRGQGRELPRLATRWRWPA